MKSNSRLHPLLAFVVIQVIWFVAVLGEPRGYGWLGLVAALVWVAVCLRFVDQPRRELAFLVKGLLYGLIADALLWSFGAIAYHSEPWLLPTTRLFMVALWLNFLTAFSTCLGWMRRRFLLGAIFGALGGASAYAAGVRLDALRLPLPPALALPMIALAWAIVVPLLLDLYERLQDPPVVAGEADR